MAATPLLAHCPPSLPRAAYVDADWHAREMRAIWARDWVCLGPAADFVPDRLTPVTVAGAPVLIARDAGGAFRAWHNLCRHRGAELCATPRPLGRRIACPYHAWTYAADDGRLVAVGHAQPTADFDRTAHGLLPVALRLWAGHVFVSLGADPPALAPDAGLDALDHWPMGDLIPADRHERVLACNWKVFWENYNECLHCPGIHPELCDMVPIYRHGVMSPGERPSADVAQALRPGAVTWTPDGQPCGPVFADLTDAERVAGHTFVTLYPTVYIVAHVDYVRSVRLEPLGPEATRLTAAWLFPPATLAQPGFDAGRVAAFAQRVLDQDADAAEMNQRGLRSPAHGEGTLMPEEFDIRRFHLWVLDRIEKEELA
jgi:Rieske 2Fe-2S family protein